MPLNFLGTLYNYDNTENLNFGEGNEVYYLNYEKDYLVEGNLGSIANASGQYQRTVSIEMYAGADEVTIKNNLSPNCTVEFYSYDTSTGIAKVIVTSYKSQAKYNFILNGMYRLWVKPYKLTINVDEGIASYNVTRRTSYEATATLGDLKNGDRLYRSDELYVSVSVTDSNNYKLKDYDREIVVFNDTTINLLTYKKHTISVEATTGSVATTINGLTYYPARGEIEVGLGAFDISITGINNRYSYNQGAGTLSYTIYGFRANKNVSATITYWT